ncbi:MAG: hypothetical protein HJJLKODD_01490 [Phycisphaerae bacterium]|nr:hypothetical protein [Phycisphaerae bacterium]
MQFCLSIMMLVVTFLAARPEEGKVFKTDAVELVAGREVIGQQDFTAQHGRFTYWFMNAANRDTFLGDPTRYEIQLAGACARMGPLSSCSRTDIFWVYEGKIYIFASEGCRSRFQKAPQDLLETDEPRPNPPSAEAARKGRELIERAVEALGGAEAFDAISFYQEIIDDVHQEGDSKPDHFIQTTTFRFVDGAIHYQWTWADDPPRGYFATPAEGYLFDADSRQIMEPVEKDSLFRRYAHHPIRLLRLRRHPDMVIWSDPESLSADPSTDVVQIWFQGVHTTLHLDFASGKIISLKYRGRDANLVIADLEYSLNDYRTSGKLLLPYRYDLIRSNNSVQKDGGHTLNMINVNNSNLGDLFLK